jgi:hypothetical protein
LLGVIEQAVSQLTADDRRGNKDGLVGPTEWRNRQTSHPAQLMATYLGNKRRSVAMR